MKYILTQMMFAGFILALYFAFEFIKKKEFKYRENRLFVQVCVWSAVWSFGFFGVFMQTEPQQAYLWRAIGMVGTFGFLISAQYLICHLSGIKGKFCRFAEGFSLFGMVIYFFVIQKDQVTYQLSSIGMTYSFSQGIWNNLYIAYTVIVALNMCVIIIYMIRNSKLQRIRELGKRLMVMEIVVVLGMILDTVFPLFGKPAIPGSTLGQFWGVLALYLSMGFVNHSRITIGNMSEFIYYSLNVPVLVYDAEEKLQILNDKGHSFFGMEKATMGKTTIRDLFFVKKEEVFVFKGNENSIDALCHYNGKECNLAINKIRDDYGDIIGYIIIVSDLSERMKSIKQLEEAKREAEYANKAKSIFLANMSHEIRTPMNAIIGFSDLLLKMDTTSEVRSHAQDIKWSSHNLLSIINDILDISKIESGKMELISDEYYTAELLDDVVKIIRPQAEKKGLSFEIEADREIPRKLYGDKARIRGVLVNVLNNAVKYTKEGFVRFEIFISKKEPEEVGLVFKVTDSGIGIKREHLATLFDHFERLDQRIHYGIEGSGLGLAIAKGYVNLMGGTIEVASRYGEGSTFSIKIKQKIVDANPMEMADIEEREEHGKEQENTFTIQNVCVLVVDDNAINLKVAQGILRTYGLNVDTAVSGPEAIEMCQKCNYPIVFMDQMMPEMDGVEAMGEIRKISTFYETVAKIVALTANAIKGNREILMREGYDEYLSKPMNIRRLEKILCAFIPKENIVFYNQKLLKPTNADERITYIKEAIPEIDVELGITHCGGKVEDYLQILEITHKYGYKQLKELKHLWNEKDYNTYNIKVHSLKSTAHNIGAKAVSEEARRQEEAGIREDNAYIAKNMDKLIADYLQILDKIENVLLHYQLIPQEPVAKPMLEEVLMRPLIKNIQKNIEKFEFAQVFDILSEVKKYQVPSRYEGDFQKVELLMDELRVDEVKELLETIWRKIDE